MSAVNPFGGSLPWQCACLRSTVQGPLPRVNPGYLAVCPDCGKRRPA